ncbi:hypothetical protein DM01DRAFT_1334200 [Hesseltinella vesiculosa]|uniref:Pre-mRNA-splicing factor CWC24 n=1 Tax=Hesseltinella vesiculosa TaxID=101127 RepID=A0A1X2GN04_9FUNG|nr:hypothetical protein DM01DRAFT_1334200 [Hesseltinella vesiculosa]
MSSKEDLITSTPAKVPFFKKRSTKNIRKRQKSNENDSHSQDDNDEMVSEVITKERKSIKPALVTSTMRRKRFKQGDEDEDDSQLGVSYEADRSTTIRRDDATRYTTEYELDKAAIEAMNKAIDTGMATKKKSKPTLTEAREPSNKKMQVGPQKAPANLRVTARFDYQPDVCKDYKETGFCGYGDSCIFLHDRGDYKSGWELDKEWEEAQKKGTADPSQYEISDSDSEDEVPFACLICRNEFANPVVTRCGHYFCEACAISNYRTNSKCFACGAPTAGVFNTAKNILEKLRAKKERQQTQNDSDEQGGLDFIEGLETKEDSDSANDSDEGNSDSDA